MPPDDAEPVVDGVDHAVVVDRPIPLHERDERAQPWVASDHDAQQALDLRVVADELRPGRPPPTAEADGHRLTLTQVRLPCATARGEERVAVADVAHRLPVVAAGLAARVVHQHQAPAEGRREGEAEDRPHRHVDAPHHAGPPLEAGAVDYRDTSWSAIWLMWSPAITHPSPRRTVICVTRNRPNGTGLPR